MKRLLAIATAVVLGSSLPVASQTTKPLSPPQQPALAALSGIEPGRWELRSRGAPSENRSICVTDPAVLLKLRHSGGTCTRFIIFNDQRMATVQYSCANAGNGRTTIRVETPRLVQIESQGVANREPFSIELEGRRAGACSATNSSLRRR